MLSVRRLVGRWAVGAAALAAATATLGAQSGTCVLTSQSGTFAAVVDWDRFGPYTYVEASFARYGGGCYFTAWDVLYTNYAGAVQVSACGGPFYLGSSSPSHTVERWTLNCDPLFLP